MTFMWGGKQFSAGDQTAFRQWLKAHGHNYASWSAAHPTAASTFISPQQSAAIAQATAEENPVILGYQQQQANLKADTAQQLKNNEGFTEALARIFANIAPLTQGVYSNAAGETGALAKGFGSADDAAAAANQAQVGGILAKAGAPAGAVGAVNAQLGGPIGDVTYGLNGFIPASGLAREGAAYSSAAAALPAYAGGLGMQNAAGINSAAALKDRDFLNQIAVERAKIPGEANDVMQQEAANAIQQRAIDVQQQQLLFDQSRLTGTYNGQPTLAAKTEADRAAEAHDALVARQKHDQAVLDSAVRAGHRPNAALSHVYGYVVDSNGHAILAQGQKVAVYKAPPTSDPRAQTHAKAVRGRENAFDQAQKEIAADAGGFVTTRSMTPAEEAAYLKKWGKLPPPEATEVTTRTPYLEAKRKLFNKYSYLLGPKYTTRRGRWKLKKQLNDLIDASLAANGITNPNPPLKPGQAPTGENG